MPGLTEFPLVLERGCGLDVHQKTVIVTVQGTDIEVETRTFGTFTSEIKELGVWLNSVGVTHIAMESTGIYWKWSTIRKLISHPYPKTLIINLKI